MSYYDFLDKKSFLKTQKKPLILLSSILLFVIIVSCIIKFGINNVEEKQTKPIQNYKVLTKEDELQLLNRIATGTPVNKLTKEQEEQLSSRIK